MENEDLEMFTDAELLKEITARGLMGNLRSEAFESITDKEIEEHEFIRKKDAVEYLEGICFELSQKDKMGILSSLGNYPLYTLTGNEVDRMESILKQIEELNTIQ